MPIYVKVHISGAEGGLRESGPQIWPTNLAHHSHSCCVYTAVHSTEKLYSTGTLPIYLYMRAITHRPRSLGWE